MGRLSGFGVTWRQMFKPRLTTEYPKVKSPKPERQHGRHVLNRYEDGMEKCIGCELCAGVCPAHCIYVRGADNPPDAPVSPGERYGFVYEINYLRCIHCDLCVEALPDRGDHRDEAVRVLVHEPRRRDHTEELIVDDDGTPPKRLPVGAGWAARTTHEQLDARPPSGPPGTSAGRLVGRVGDSACALPKRGRATMFPSLADEPKRLARTLMVKPSSSRARSRGHRRRTR